jgi:hypothetical protein
MGIGITTIGEYEFEYYKNQSAKRLTFDSKTVKIAGFFLGVTQIP